MNTKGISRRQLLKNATTMCAASALGSAPFVSACSNEPLQAQPQKRTSSSISQLDPCQSSAPCTVGSDFTIVLHGLFLIELWLPGNTHIPVEQKVRIFTPDCSKLKHVSHVYKAGSWGKPFSTIQGPNDYYPAWNLPKATMTKDVNLPRMKNQAGNTVRSGRYCSLYLPYPKSIRALRVISQSAVTSSSVTNPADYPLVTALTYGADRPSAPPIPVDMSSWDSKANFHIFAEPDCVMTCEQMVAHGNETQLAARKLLAAYDVQLASAVDCKLKPPPPVPLDSCPPNLGVPGVKCEEEKSLWELSGARSCAGSERDVLAAAVHMPTCASVILDAS